MEDIEPRRICLKCEGFPAAEHRWYCEKGSGVRPPLEVVAIINTSPDMVALLRDVMQHFGFGVVSGYTFDVRDGHLDLDQLFTQHNPRVVIYDIAPPYDQNVQLFDRVRAMPVMEGRRFVITSTNPRHVEALIGPRERVYELVGKAYDLYDILAAVSVAARTLRKW